LPDFLRAGRRRSWPALVFARSRAVRFFPLPGALRPATSIIVASTFEAPSAAGALGPCVFAGIIGVDVFVGPFL
jgi:hypothetical protein